MGDGATRRQSPRSMAAVDHCAVREGTPGHQAHSSVTHGVARWHPRYRKTISRWCDHRACSSVPGKSPMDPWICIAESCAPGHKAPSLTYNKTLVHSSTPFRCPSSTWLYATWERLRPLMSLVSGFYERQLFAIEAYTSARWHRAHTGLLQGCPISPLLSLSVGFLWSQFVVAPRIEAGIYVDDRVLWLTDQDPGARRPCLEVTVLIKLPGSLVVEESAIW